MSKDPCRPHTVNTQWSMWVCLLTLDCLSHYNFHNMAYKKKFNLVKWGVELKMNWLNWSIPISSVFQFQFNSNSKSCNSIPIQFMLNWIELIINSNSIHELIRALSCWPLLGLLSKYPACESNHCKSFNTLWPSDAIWQHRYESTLAQVVAWWHMRYLSHQSLKLTWKLPL